MSSVESITLAFPTQNEANSKADELRLRGYTVFVPSINPGAQPLLTGSTNTVLLDFHAVDPNFPVGGIQFDDVASDGSIETIVAGIPDPTSSTVKSLATKVFLLKDTVNGGRNLVQIESEGLKFDGYVIFVPGPTGGFPPGLPAVTGETAKILLDATDVLRNLVLPGVLERSRPYIVTPPAGSSLWIVAARRVVP